MTTTKTLPTAQDIRTAHQLLLCLSRNWHIFTLIADNPGITVTEMFIRLRMDQGDVSCRLLTLRAYDLVSGERNGKNIHYHITDRAIDIATKINKHVSWKK